MSTLYTLSMSFFYNFFYSRFSDRGTRMSWKDETAKARARDQGSLEVKGNTAMSMPVLKNLIKHLKLYSPTAVSSTSLHALTVLD